MTLRPLEKTHTGVPEMSTFKTHPPAPSRSTSPFFPVPWLFSGEASGHLARVLGGSSPSCPLFQGTREGGKGPTVGLDLGFQQPSQPRGLSIKRQETLLLGGLPLPCWCGLLPGYGVGAAHGGPVLGDHSTC